MAIVLKFAPLASPSSLYPTLADPGDSDKGSAQGCGHALVALVENRERGTLNAERLPTGARSRPFPP